MKSKGKNFAFINSKKKGTVKASKGNKILSKKQQKLDKNKNGKIDGGDFKMMRKNKKK